MVKGKVVLLFKFLPHYEDVSIALLLRTTP